MPSEAAHAKTLRRAGTKDLGKCMSLKPPPLLKDTAYDPGALLDRVSALLNVKNDAALARELDVAPPVISKIRHRNMAVGASLLIRLHEVTALSIQELRTTMGDTAKRFRTTPRGSLQESI